MRARLEQTKISVSLITVPTWRDTQKNHTQFGICMFRVKVAQVGMSSQARNEKEVEQVLAVIMCCIRFGHELLAVHPTILANRSARNK